VALMFGFMKWGMQPCVAAMGIGSEKEMCLAVII
jgi:hypothetical protein